MLQTAAAPSRGGQTVLSVPLPDMSAMVLFLLRLWSGKSRVTRKIILNNIYIYIFLLSHLPPI